MGLNICPYYYKNDTRNFEHCHKPKDIKNCLDERKSNECKVITLTFENVVFNIELINEIMSRKEY
jgi:hypothetical protein